MSETMKAAIFVEPGKMTVEEVPKAALICGSSVG